jgi:hypothetical protein
MMAAHVNVKPLMHWLIYRHYTVRITKRAIDAVEGIMTTPDGPVNFRYDPTAQLVYLPEKTVAINQYGWEIDSQ